MSKTVKRVMRIMMVGLVAMLGAKAEAHYFWFFGKIKFCSVCLDPGTDDQGNDLSLTDVPADLNDPSKPAPAVVELSVKAKLVEISCPQPPTVIQSKVNVTLEGETPSDLWGYDPNAETAVVSVRVDDDSLNNVCPGRGEVRILKMSATANAYECTGLDPANPCSSRVLISIMKFNNCTIPSGAPLDTLYDCNAPDIQHNDPV